MDFQRLATIGLGAGGHGSPADGLCAMEAVALLEGLDHGASPACTCPVIAAFVRRANDRMPPDRRQDLMGHAPRLAGTVSPEAEGARAEWVVGLALRTAVAEMLRSVGLPDFAGRLAALPEGDWAAAAAVVGQLLPEVDSADRLAARALEWAGRAASWAGSGAREWAAAGAASAIAWSAHASRAARAWDTVFDALDGMLAIGGPEAGAVPGGSWTRQPSRYAPAEA